MSSEQNKLLRHFGGSRIRSAAIQINVFQRFKIQTSWIRAYLRLFRRVLQTHYMCLDIFFKFDPVLALVSDLSPVKKHFYMHVSVYRSYLHAASSSSTPSVSQGLVAT